MKKFVETPVPESILICGIVNSGDGNSLCSNFKIKMDANVYIPPCRAADKDDRKWLLRTNTEHSKNAKFVGGKLLLEKYS